MYLYLGGKYFIRDKDIEGIFDLDSSTVSKITREFLNFAERSKKIIYANMYELPRSFVLTAEKIYITPIAASTLNRRLVKKLI